MPINPVNGNNIIDFYSNKSKSIAETKNTENTNDSIQISKLGKSLSAYSLDNNFSVSPAKLAEIKNSIENGTYNRDSKLVAQKLYDNLKGRGV